MSGGSDPLLWFAGYSFASVSFQPYPCGRAACPEITKPSGVGRRPMLRRFSAAC